MSECKSLELKVNGAKLMRSEAAFAALFDSTEGGLIPAVQQQAYAIQQARVGDTGGGESSSCYMVAEFRTLDWDDEKDGSQTNIVKDLNQLGMYCPLLALLAILAHVLRLL
eukprot:GHVU01137799.1.p3 GENE.GHVU01137799.1~~GHVU01137799.1.p3  ORF type:complete len:111 (-),score=16.73 GHVU01137799.1:1238-1570(-)